MNNVTCRNIETINRNSVLNKIGFQIVLFGQKWLNFILNETPHIFLIINDYLQRNFDKKSG